MLIVGELNISNWILMGFGLSDVYFRVLKVMVIFLVGYLDFEFVMIMDEIKIMV